jgi:two-component system sensor histidine kinase AtoS
MEQEAQSYALAVAQSIASASTHALLTYDYVTLEQHAEQASRDTDIVYVIILDKENRVAAFSGHEGRQGNYVNHPVQQKSLAATSPVVQSVLWQETGKRALDITVPVFSPDSELKWGTVRVGLSLERMYWQVRRTQLVLLGIGAVALILALIGAQVMAGRITLPLARMIDATVAAAEGDLNQHLDIHTKDEIEDLANSFNTMLREISAQMIQLEQRLAAIAELKAYNDIVLASMGNGVMTFDLEARLISANEAAESILGLEGKHWQAKRYREVWPEDNPFVRLLDECTESRTALRNQEISLDTGESQQRSLIANTSLLEDEQGKMMGILVVIQDITELKRLESRMRQDDRLAALGTLSAGLAHEIRNPLSAIKTFVQLLPKKISHQAFLDKFHTTVPRELNRINDLIESLLELARPLKLEFEICSLRDCYSQAADLYRDQLAAAGVSFEILEEEPLPDLWADKDHLVTAFSHLMINAQEAMEEGGDLMVKAEPVAGGVAIRFTDTGVGMDEATKDKIFNPFFTSKDTGTGLGLTITHKIIQEHGGSIQVDSTPGSGTTFVITLPGVQR